MSFDYVKYLNLVEYAVTALLNIYSIYAFSAVLRLQLSGGRQQKSPFLVLYLIAWISTIALSFPFLAYMLSQWRPYGELSVVAIISTRLVHNPYRHKQRWTGDLLDRRLHSCLRLRHPSHCLLPLHQPHPLHLTPSALFRHPPVPAPAYCLCLNNRLPSSELRRLHSISTHDDGDALSSVCVRGVPEGRLFLLLYRQQTTFGSAELLCWARSPLPHMAAKVWL